MIPYCDKCDNILVSNGDNYKCRICNREFTITHNEEGEVIEVKPAEETAENNNQIDAPAI